MTQISLRNSWIRSTALLGFGVILLAAATVRAQQRPNDVNIGRRLFIRGEFRGNGRTCVTCHSVRTGDITLEQIQTP